MKLFVYIYRQSNWLCSGTVSRQRSWNKRGRKLRNQLKIIQALAFILEQPPEAIYKKAILKNFAKFAGEEMRQSFFFKKVAGLRLRLRTCKFLKKTLGWYKVNILSRIFFLSFFFFKSIFPWPRDMTFYETIIFQRFLKQF